MVLAIDGALRVDAEGGIVGGGLRQTGEQGRFGQVEVFGVFIEEDLGSLFDAVGSAAVGDTV